MKKIISFVMLLVLLVTIIPIVNIEANASISGIGGENVIWEYDASSKTLTVSGTGDMKNYNQFQSFDGNYNKIETIIITDGVTSIGSYFFGICESATSISIPESVIEINNNAFENCSSLKNVYFEGTRDEWNEIIISSIGNDCLINATIVCNKEPHVCVFNEWTTTIEPTCVGSGTEIRECSCGKKEENEIPPTNKHDYIWKVTIEATCTENGQETSYCSVCNKKGETKSINKLGHKYGEWATEVEPTCTNNGLQVKKCDNCGIVLEQNIIMQLPHNFTDWKTTVKETEEHDGEETRTCKSCKYTETRVIDNIQSSNKNKIVIGDANGDGKVMATDARLVLQVVAGLKDNKAIDVTNADVNEDNKITALDARLILQIVAGIK